MEHSEVKEVKKSSKCKLVGNTNEAMVTLGGVECLALIDTGSMFTNVSEGFYHAHLTVYFPLLQLDKILQIEASGGHMLEYLGYIEVNIGIPGTKVELWVPVLVMPDTGFSKEVPVLIGTNVICEMRDSDLDTGSSSIWKSSIACLVKDESAEDFTIYSCREVVINPDQTVVVSGQVGGRNKNQTGVVQGLDTLTGGLIMAQAAVEVDCENKVQFQISNISGRKITIPRRQRIAQFQQGRILMPTDSGKNPELKIAQPLTGLYVKYCPIAQSPPKDPLLAIGQV